MREEIIKLDDLQYHRNGSFGESFYSCVVSLKKEKGKFLVTFNTNESDMRVLIESCRAIKLSNFSQMYRGDDFARWLNQFFIQGREHGLLKIYDFYKAFSCLVNN